MDRQIKARAAELALGGSKTVADGEALRQALDERCGGDYGRALDLLVAEGRSQLRDARQRTYNLPEQATLFDLPAVIAVSTPLGDLFIPAELATAGQVEQWAREGTAFHSGQHKRFKAIVAQLKDLELDPSANYRGQLGELSGGAE